MKKVTLLVALATVLLISLVTGCSAGQCGASGANNSGTGARVDPADADCPGGGQQGRDAARGNFRLLVSDEPNAIGNFTALCVEISSLAFVRVGEEGGVVTKSLNASVEVDLTELQGDNAVEVWNGNLPEGDYAKVFLYVANVTSVPQRDVKLPGDKLHISKPFTIGGDTENATVDFVFDISVIQAGNSGQYILKPQLSQSGPDQPFRLRERSEAGVRIRDRDRDRVSRPEDARRPGNTGKADNVGRPEHAGKPGSAGKPGHTGSPANAACPMDVQLNKLKQLTELHKLF